MRKQASSKKIGNQAKIFIRIYKKSSTTINYLKYINYLKNKEKINHKS